MASKCIRRNIKENISKVKESFMAGIGHVQPHELMKRHLQRNGDTLTINKVKYDLKDNVYVVGFGKAVIGMVRPVEEALKNFDGSSHLQEGVISVPLGIQETFASLPHLLPKEDSIIKIEEGAKDNIPDIEAFKASKKILSLVEKLVKDDLLIVLISGGGSALLPYPRPPLTLDEKSELVKALSKKGATITELNTVRKALSLTKGGKLASTTKANVVSLILSDIIDSPLDMIASGPTVANIDQPYAAEMVLKKYDIDIPYSIKDALKKHILDSEERKDFPNVNNCIIGSSETALKGVLSSIRKMEGENCQSLILTSSLNGQAAQVGRKMLNFAVAVLDMLCGNRKLDVPYFFFLDTLCISKNMTTPLKHAIDEAMEKQLPIWLIFGGETTVHVKGDGKGGRNQEMVLSFSKWFNEKSNCIKSKGDIVFLSGGTDGIDGPTDAAGAVTYCSSFNADFKCQVKEAKEQGLCPNSFLKNNDSYSYFSNLNSGEYLLKPGHTGTNVMDIQILYINPCY